MLAVSVSSLLRIFRIWTSEFGVSINVAPIYMYAKRSEEGGICLVSCWFEFNSRVSTILGLFWIAATTIQDQVVCLSYSNSCLRVFIRNVSFYFSYGPLCFSKAYLASNLTSNNLFFMSVMRTYTLQWHSADRFHNNFFLWSSYIRTGSDKFVIKSFSVC